MEVFLEEQEKIIYLILVLYEVDQLLDYKFCVWAYTMLKLSRQKICIYC